jgi:Spy/CpxP family protein refolding chaperone
MKRSRIALITALLSIVTVAFAQPYGGPPGRERMNGKHEQLKEALNLTDQQETQIKKLRLELERKQTQVHSKIQLAHLDVKEMFLSEKIERAAIEKSIKQISELQLQTKMNFVDFWFSANGLLTPDQQKVWKQHVGRIGEGMRGRMRAGMHRGGPMMPRPPDEDDDD